MAKRILIVDDSDIIRSHCRTILQKAGYEVVEAWDASQARTALKTMEIAFMLCDLNMPAIDGIELVSAMRKDPRFTELPVVMLTAEHNAELARRADQARVAGWLRKPYTSEQLLAVVRQFAGAA